METEQLKNFVRVAQRQSFTKAAAEIGLSQSAISRSIAKLEEELGQPVFERQRKRVALTDAGQQLYPRAQQILNLIEDTKAEICDDGESGKVRLAAIPTIAPFLLPSLLQKIAKSFPKAQLTVHEDTTDRLVKRLAEGESDLALVALPIAGKHVEVAELFEEPLLLVVPKSHPLAKKKRVSLGDVEALPFVLLDEVHCLSGNILSFCSQRSLQPIVTERTSQLATIQELVTLGHGISLIPAMARRHDESPRRVYRSFVPPAPTRKIALAWNPYRFQSALIARIRQMIVQECSKFRT